MEGSNNYKFNTNNSDDNARVITAISKRIEEHKILQFDFEFVVNDNIYLNVSWFQDWYC